MAVTGNPNAKDFLIQSQESTINALQNQLAALKHDVAALKIENHVLRIKNGQVQQGVMEMAAVAGGLDEDKFRAVPSDRVERALLEWGDVAVVLQAGSSGLGVSKAADREQMLCFCHDLMVWSVQRWIGGRRVGDLVLDAPGCVVREVVECDQAWCTKRIDKLVAFMESTIGVDAMRRAMEEVVWLVLCRWCDGAGMDGADGGKEDWEPLVSVLLTHFVSSDAIRCGLLVRSACRMCVERLQDLVGDVLGRASEQVQNAPQMRPLHSVQSLVDLIDLCDTCIARLVTADPTASASATVTVEEATLRDVAEAVFDIGQQCDVVASMLPDVALPGKRLQCQLVAALQRMEAAPA